MKVARWGNSLAIRLPASVVEALQLKEGDNVEVGLVDDRKLELDRSPSRADAVRRMREILKGALPADYKFDREEANRR